MLFWAICFAVESNSHFQFSLVNGTKSKFLWGVFSVAVFCALVVHI
jgi:hypothetical protein